MSRNFAGRDILSLRNMERHEYMKIFSVADKLMPHARDRKNGTLLADKTLVTAFYQPSTRTRLATEAGMHRLGGHVLGFSDAKMTRAGDFYQESIKDTVNMLEYYGDVIAMRHFKQGAPHEAAKHASIPIINCGDGWGEHPTQVLTDLYTIYKERGTLDGLTILCVGDLRMRTMHSIGYAFARFDVKVHFVSPPDMGMLPEYRKEVTDMGLQFEEFKSVHECIHLADVIYMEPVVQPDYTKARTEVPEDYWLTPKEYIVNKELLFAKAKQDAIILHSLPRMDELPLEVDETRFQRYWQEAFNGVVMRMALLALILGRAE